MKCPTCAGDSAVLDSRVCDGGETIRRRRQCLACKRRWTTYEITQVNLNLIKRKAVGARLMLRRYLRNIDKALSA